jgi:carbonic anhydrase
MALEYGSNTDKFKAVQFHYHTPSEHTINGEHKDLEIHIVHAADTPNPGDKIQYGVIGVLFSVEDYTETITKQ